VPTRSGPSPARSRASLVSSRRAGVNGGQFVYRQPQRNDLGWFRAAPGAPTAGLLQWPFNPISPGVSLTADRVPVGDPATGRAAPGLTCGGFHRLLAATQGRRAALTGTAPFKLDG
jgi:hypothetical protein